MEPKKEKVVDSKKIPTEEEIKAKLNEIWDAQGFSCEPDGQGNYIIQDKGSFARVNAEVFDKQVRASWEEELKKYHMENSEQVLDTQLSPTTKAQPKILESRGIQTYKFYTHKGERLSIFLDNYTIVVIRCSLKDQFRKKTARELFQNYKSDQGYKPEVHTFDHELNGKEFFQWCKDTYYIKTESKGECMITWLVNKAKTNQSTRIVLKSTPYKKMWN